MISDRFNNILIMLYNNFWMTSIKFISITFWFIIVSRKNTFVNHYVCLMLIKFRKINLQINIKKYKFDIEKIVFLNIIISKSDLRVNSEKLKIIVNWIILINLKKIQGFIEFANFYRRFIKKNFKIIKFLIKLTKKDQFFV